MFLEYYNLREQPFGAAPDPRFLYFGNTHREALASLLYGLESGQGFAALIAEPGMGKTTLLFRLLELLSVSATTAFIFQTQCNPCEFIRCLATDLGIETPAHEIGGLIEQINRLLIREAEQERRVVLVIDEAQNLEPSVLETIRMLSNFETPRFKLLQIVLAGQPQLADKLMSPDLIQLRQRISTLTRLSRLKPNETADYIRHRMRMAGHMGPSLFTPGALSLIKACSGGIPRNINTLCFNALSLGCAMGKKRIRSAVVREAAADLDLRLFAALKPVKKEDGPAAETPPTRGGVRKPVNSLPSACLRMPVGSSPPVQSKARALLWAGGATCALFLLICSIPWFPAHVQNADPPTASTASLTAGAAGNFTVIVKRNDTLSEVCRQRLGRFDARVVKEIRRLNPELSDLSRLKIGQQIRLPFVPKSAVPKAPE